MGYSELIAARLAVGDKVSVITLWGKDPATIISTPAGPGDLWQFRRPDGSVFALNPYGRTFVRIEKK